MGGVLQEGAAFRWDGDSLVFLEVKKKVGGHEHRGLYPGQHDGMIGRRLTSQI